jgi:hypothetical protein
MAVGQNKYGKQRNLPSFDDKPYHFGFALGINSAGSFIDQKLNTSFSDSLLTLTPKNGSGFNIGIVTSLNIFKNFSLRFIPSLSFQDRVVLYEFLGPEDKNLFFEKRIESTFIDFPFNFKWRSNRLNNMAVYVLFGGKYSLDVASQEDVNNLIAEDIILKLKKNDFSGEVGGGFDFFLPYFKLGIELKLSVGIPNVLIDDNTKFSSPIESFRTRTFMISFTFEG